MRIERGFPGIRSISLRFSKVNTKATFLKTLKSLKVTVRWPGTS